MPQPGAGKQASWALFLPAHPGGHDPPAGAAPGTGTGQARARRSIALRLACTSGLAPPSSSAAMASARPASAALCSGVSPPIVLASTEALALSSAAMTAAWPPSAAKCCTVRRFEERHESAPDARDGRLRRGRLALPGGGQAGGNSKQLGGRAYVWRGAVTRLPCRGLDPGGHPDLTSAVAPCAPFVLGGTPPASRRRTALRSPFAAALGSSCAVDMPAVCRAGGGT